MKFYHDKLFKDLDSAFKFIKEMHETYEGFNSFTLDMLEEPVDESSYGISVGIVYRPKRKL